MVNIIIENRLPELEATYHIFENLRVAPYPISQIIITFKNSRTATIYRNSTIKIDNHKCYIEGEVYDLRENKIAAIDYFT